MRRMVKNEASNMVTSCSNEGMYINNAGVFKLTILASRNRDQVYAPIAFLQLYLVR